MKKLLFSALIAVAAIGGATAFPVYNSNGEYIGDCVNDPIQNPDCGAVSQNWRDAEGRLFTEQELSGLDFEPAP